MIDLLRRIINNGQKSKPIDIDFKGTIEFELKINELIIGHLSVEDGQWVFKYSEQFKNQNEYARLTGFSDLNKIYKADVLWPFFKVRIPGLKQPMIRDIIKSENLDESNEALLLKRFGRLTMTNPYILEPK